MTTLDQIKNRLAAATPGPWVEYHENGTPGQREAFNCPPATGAFLVDYTDDWDQKNKDATFIAHAPEDIARLLAALEAVERQCKYWDTLADGDKHCAARVRAAIAEALEGKK